MRRRAGAWASVLAVLLTVAQALPAVAASDKGLACGRRSFAAAIGTNGKVLWRSTMIATSDEFQGSFDPVVGPTLSYWPEDGVVHALQNKDGHEAWEVRQGYALNGVWLTHGVVTILSDDFEDKGVLSGLNARTGAVLWRLVIPGKGLTLDQPVLTGDGGLVWLRADGRLQSVDLVTGRIRWTKVVGTASSIKKNGLLFTAGGGRVYVAQKGKITEYGRRGFTSWTIAATTDRGSLKLIRGELLIITHTQAEPSAIKAVDARTGASSWGWSFDVDGEFILASDGYSIIVGRILGPNVFRFDVATGHQVWVRRLALFFVQGEVAVSGDYVAEIDAGVTEADGGELVVRDLASGDVLWQHPLTNDAAYGSVAFIGGSVVLIPDGERADPNEPLYGFDSVSGAPTWTITSLRPLQGRSTSATKTSYVSAADQTATCPS